jgi:putative hemolysin
MKTVIALAAAALLAACSSTTMCVQPDPVQPVSGAWEKGLDAGTGIQKMETSK